ncbi:MULTISPECIES: Sec-independent protein translocase subunit TatA/TatB [Emticicia]|jgi:sec-independent protein translocase protein TatA|uniref:Sec-independent protein translocase protein TatA n=1 Tax=Emticicia soli TaxID=2027878 RepID=A0ABW5JA01_9BACT|nr:twin-arginine translocase TatA/TatE family subunit [Emticicia sp. BO119]MBA4853251.1 twin-arginine translocase TatA/TatE family subunit [Emticicia sp. BO119]
MFGLGTTEMVLILVVVLFFFGAKKLPELARGLGKGIREFKDASREVKENIEKAASEDTK